MEHTKRKDAASECRIRTGRSTDESGTEERSGIRLPEREVAGSLKLSHRSYVGNRVRGTMRGTMQLV